MSTSLIIVYDSVQDAEPDCHLYSPKLGGTNMIFRSLVEPDSGFAWVVLVSGFLNVMTSLGVAINGCSVYLAAMIESYGCSRTEAYVAGALSSGLFFFSAPVASVFIDKVGLRTAAVVGAVMTTTGLVLSANVPTLEYHYITLSVTAIGCGFMYQSALVVPVQYFVKHRALASSLVYVAGGVTMMVSPNVVRLVIDTYTWRPSFYIIAAIALNTCVPSMLIRPTSIIKYDRAEIRQKIYDEPSIEADKPKSVIPQLVLNCKKDFAFRETFTDNDYPSNHKTLIREAHREHTEKVHMSSGLVRNCLFWLFLANSFLFEVALTPIVIIMPDMYVVGGMNDWQTGVLFILWGCSNTLGRVLSGILWLRLASPLVVYCSANLIWASALLLFVGNTSFLCLVFANVLTGLGHGSFVTCFSIVAADLVGVRLVNRALGFSLFSGGIGAVLASPILGKLYDATKSYTWSVLVAALAGFVCFFDVLLMICRRSNRKKAHQQVVSPPIDIKHS